MNPPENAPRLRDYLLMLSRGWFVVVLATVLAAGTGWVSWHTMTPLYQSSSRVMVMSPGAATSFDAFYGQLNSSSRTLTHQLLTQSDQVTGRTIEQLGLSDTPEELAGRILVVPSEGTTFDIVATASDSAQARELAQAVTTNLVDVQRGLAELDGSATELVVLDDAGPAKRVGSMWSTVLQAGALGLVMSMLIVIAWALVRDRVLGRSQLDALVGNGTDGASRATPGSR